MGYTTHKTMTNTTKNTTQHNTIQHNTICVRHLCAFYSIHYMQLVLISIILVFDLNPETFVAIFHLRVTAKPIVIIITHSLECMNVSCTRILLYICTDYI